MHAFIPRAQLTHTHTHIRYLVHHSLIFYIHRSTLLRQILNTLKRCLYEDARPYTISRTNYSFAHSLCCSHSRSFHHTITHVSELCTTKCSEYFSSFALVCCSLNAFLSRLSFVHIHRNLFFFLSLNSLVCMRLRTHARGCGSHLVKSIQMSDENNRCHLQKYISREIANISHNHLTNDIV